MRLVSLLLGVSATAITASSCTSSSDPNPPQDGGPHDDAPADASVTLGAPLGRAFRGFGGSFVFNVDGPLTDASLDGLRVAWARTELPLWKWEPVNDDNDPTSTDWSALAASDTEGSYVRSKLIMAQKLAQRGIPQVMSIFVLPSWLYTPVPRDPWEGNTLDQSKWPELLESIASYLIYARDSYGVKPELVSFNEPDIGSNVLLSAAELRDANERIAAHLASRGLSTKVLLGDVSNPKASEYVGKAAEAVAGQGIGGVSFHSYNWDGVISNATAAEYDAWRALADQRGLPLFVTEAGFGPTIYEDPASYKSYGYMLLELHTYQLLLRRAQPETLIYWEFTTYDEQIKTFGAVDNDVHAPNTRWWLFKQLHNLTPQPAQYLATESGSQSVLVSAFASGNALAVHLLNLGGSIRLRVEGLGDAPVEAVVTSETLSFKTINLPLAVGGATSVDLPARSLVTLYRSG
jgi:hypothetical protein